MDAKQLGALTPRSFGGPSNDKEPVNTGKKFSKEHREKLSAARRRFWNVVDEERRREHGAKSYAARRKSQQLKGNFRAPGSDCAGSVGVDSDFDEMEY